MGDDFIKGDGEIYVETNYMFLKNHSSHHQESPILFQVKHHTKNDTGKINRDASFRWSFGPHSAWGSIEPMIILSTHPSLSWYGLNKLTFFKRILA